MISIVSKHAKRYWILILVAAFLIVLVAGYAIGLRPGPGLTIVRVGTLTVTGLPAGSTVYADQSPRGTADKSGIVSARLVPGAHTVIVDIPENEPWEKIVMIASNETVSVSPVVVPKHPSAEHLNVPASITAAALAVSKTKLPLEASPLQMGCADVFTSDNRVIVKAATTTPGCTAPEYLCTEGSCAPTIAYAPVAPLRSVIPFPGRTDAVIVTAGEWVYAVALDPRNPQFFAPIFHATAPVLGAASTTSFYVLDIGKYYLFSF